MGGSGAGDDTGVLLAGFAENPVVRIVINPDDDLDGYPNRLDLFPDNPEEWANTDGDGMGDNNYESEYGLDPYQNDALTDRDGDGFSNLREFISGSDPSDNTDSPPCLADFNGDHVVDGSDLDHFSMEVFNQICRYDPSCLGDFW